MTRGIRRNRWQLVRDWSWLAVPVGVAVAFAWLAWIGAHVDHWAHGCGRMDWWPL